MQPVERPSPAQPLPPVAPTPSPNEAPLLAVRDLSKTFQGLQALVGYELDLREGSIHGVIGPNGAGKTTLFHLLSGFLHPTRGTITFDGVDITGAPAWKASRLGIRRTFQNIRLFGDLSVVDNVKVGLQRSQRPSLLGALFTTPGFRRQERELQARAIGLLDVVGLADRLEQPARSLPYGHQRRLEIARAIGNEPRVLLLDEPNAGMNPIETQELLKLIRRLRDDLRITVVLVAHDIPLVMGVCDRIQVLNHGRLIAEGDPAAVRSNPDVIAAYLGQARHA